MYPARSSLREAAMRMLPTKLPVALYGARAKGILRAGIAAATQFLVGQGRHRARLGLRGDPGQAQESRTPEPCLARPEDKR